MKKKIERNVKPTEANDDGLSAVVNIKKLLLQDRNSKRSHLKYEEKNINLKKNKKKEIKLLECPELEAT